MRIRGAFMRRTKPQHKRPGPVIGWVVLALCLGLTARADEQTLNKVTAISVEEGAQTTKIIVRGSTAPTFSVTRLVETGPPRLFVDLSNAEFINVPSPIEVENGVVSMIHVQRRANQLVRIGQIIVGLELDAPHALVNVVGNQLVKMPLMPVRGSNLSWWWCRILRCWPRDRAQAEAAEARAKAAEEKAAKSAKAADAPRRCCRSQARSAQASALAKQQMLEWRPRRQKNARPTRKNEPMT